MMRFFTSMSLRGRKPEAIPLQRGDCHVVASLLLEMTLLISCTPVDLNARMPTFDTGIDPDSWAQVAAGATTVPEVASMLPVKATCPEGSALVVKNSCHPFYLEE